MTNLFDIADHFVSYRWVSGPHNFLLRFTNCGRMSQIST